MCIHINVKGLLSFTSWRTFITGLVIGYIFAWKIHYAVQMWSYDHGWVEERIPILTPLFGYKN